MRYFVFLQIILLFYTSPALGLEAYFADRTEVAGPIVRLGDVVRFDGESEMTRALASERIATRPPVGQELVLKRNIILRQLAAKSPLPPEIRWSGAENIRIVAKKHVITADFILDRIDAYLLRKLDDFDEMAFSFTPAELPRPFELPPGELAIHITPSKRDLIGSNRFSINIKVDGKTKKTMSVRGKLECLAPLYIASHDIARGTTLSYDLFDIETVDIASVRHPYLASSPIEDIKLTRKLAAGQALSRSIVEIIPLVLRGEKVQVLVKSGNLRIQMSGIARANGGKGEMIRVQNTSSNKLFYGKVMAPGIVEVQI